MLANLTSEIFLLSAFLCNRLHWEAECSKRLQTVQVINGFKHLKLGCPSSPQLKHFIGNGSGVLLLYAKLLHISIFCLSLPTY